MTAYRLMGVLLAGLIVAGCGKKPAPEPEPEARLVPVAFAELEGWASDDQAAALTAFRRSCERYPRQPQERGFGREAWAGKIGDWTRVCEASAGIEPGASAARAFFEAQFQPFAVLNRDEPQGLFTGYYEPVLEGARQPDERFRVPLHRRPPDLVSIDLGLFDPGLEGRRFAGRVEDGKLVPYPARGQIDQGALDGKGLELLWVDDRVAKFFLEIQGSGQIRLKEGGIARVGFADQNGRAYRAIGKDLVEMGAIPKDKVSLQTIRAWLVAHPAEAPGVMAKNPSYVFFRELKELDHASGPLGAQNVPLTPGRSLAVDRRFMPLGAPLWIETTAPPAVGGGRLARLVVAQDTGGAIRGPVRGDLFWGAGAEAEDAAGHMQSRGRYYILLPRSLAPTS